MSNARKHYIAGRPNPSHIQRCDALREVASDIFALSERMTIPARSHDEAERWIGQGEELAQRLRRIFR